MTTDGLFGRVREFPDDDARERFAALVGLDDAKQRLVTEARILLDAQFVETWSKKHHHGRVLRAAQALRERTPLIVLAGDVGTGKTELAESLGDPVARALRIDVTLFPLSLSARGHGAVGEMTTLLTRAFSEVRNQVGGARGAGRPGHAAILLVDEADALAQSRELAQMHHEDRAGVNALLRGIDDLHRDRLPVLTILCTNRGDALDPAVLRRAAAIFRLTRPNDVQRRDLLARELDGIDLSDKALDNLVRLTGSVKGRDYGCTYSDLRRRFVPSAVLDAVDRGAPVTADRLLELARQFEPTRPFDAGNGSGA